MGYKWIELGLTLIFSHVFLKEKNIYFSLSKSCSKLLGVKCINLDSPISRKSSKPQINKSTCSLIIK